MKPARIRRAMSGQIKSNGSLLILLIGCCIWGFSNQSVADVLATTRTESFSFGAPNDNPTSVTYQFGVPKELDMGFPIFEGFALAPADVGKTFVANAANDPDFVGLVAILTNGVSDWVREQLADSRIGAAEIVNEGAFFFGDGSGAHVDFYGYSISSISLRVDQLSLANGISFQGTITVEGSAIPEPSTVALASLGLFILVGFYAFRRERNAAKSSEQRSSCNELVSL